MRTDQLAAQTWDKDESLEETNRRIHDSSLDEAGLLARADDYVRRVIFGNFAQAMPHVSANILEIGSGVGWIMQAMHNFLTEMDRIPSKIIGLDIAQNMLAKARERLGERLPYAYQLYDGVTVPLKDGSLDLIYSVASLQHVPRPFVFNLFFEIQRLLKPSGFAVLHFLSTDCLPRQEAHWPWRKEIDSQIYGREAHWHHFYTAKELHDVLTITGFPYVAIRDDGAGEIVVCISNGPLSLPIGFDPGGYLRLNHDVATDNANPTEHYLIFGHKEGRHWTGWQGQKQNPPEEPPPNPQIEADPQPEVSAQTGSTKIKALLDIIIKRCLGH